MSPAPCLPERLQALGKGCPPVEGTPIWSRLGLPEGDASPNPRGETGRRECKDGEVAEWLKAHAWKVCLRETVTRVRIPLSPPYHQQNQWLEKILEFTRQKAYHAGRYWFR